MRTLILLFFFVTGMLCIPLGASAVYVGVPPLEPARDLLDGLDPIYDGAVNVMFTGQGVDVYLLGLGVNTLYFPTYPTATFHPAAEVPGNIDRTFCDPWAPPDGHPEHRSLEYAPEYEQGIIASLIRKDYGLLPNARIHSIDIGTPDCWPDPAYLAAALNWIIDNHRSSMPGILVVNATFYGPSQTDPLWFPVFDAVNRAIASNFIAIAHLGSGGTSPYSWPDSIPGVVKVGDVDLTSPGMKFWYTDVPRGADIFSIGGHLSPVVASAAQILEQEDLFGRPNAQSAVAELFASARSGLIDFLPAGEPDRLVRLPLAPEWDSRFSVAQTESAGSSIFDAGSGVVYISSTINQSDGTNKALFAARDTQGSELWHHEIQGAEGYDVDFVPPNPLCPARYQCAEGRVYFTAVLNDQPIGIVYAVSMDGKLLWSREIDTDYGLWIDVVSDPGLNPEVLDGEHYVAVAGSIERLGWRRQFFVEIIVSESWNAPDDVQWSARQEIGLADADDFAHDIVMVAAGPPDNRYPLFVVCGESRNAGVTEASFSFNGNPAYQTIGSPFGDKAILACDVTPEKTITVAGRTNGQGWPNYSSSAWLAQFDATYYGPSGAALEWSRSFSGSPGSDNFINRIFHRGGDQAIFFAGSSTGALFGAPRGGLDPFVGLAREDGVVWGEHLLAGPSDEVVTGFIYDDSTKMAYVANSDLDSGLTTYEVYRTE